MEEVKDMDIRGYIKRIYYTLRFCVLFIPGLLIDLYRIAIEVPEWEKKGIDEGKDE